VRKKAPIAVFCMLALCAGAQKNTEMIIVNSPADATKTMEGIRIEGFVPDVLKISLDFAPDNSALLVGYYPSEAAARQASGGSAPPSPGDRSFSIHPGKVVDLGSAILVSNVVGPYTISVFSANDGHLTSAEAEAKAGIPYSLGLGDRLSRAESGVFRFSGSGKSHAGGIRLKVFLVFDELALPLPHSTYTDELSFVVSAN